MIQDRANNNLQLKRNSERACARLVLVAVRNAKNTLVTFSEDAVMLNGAVRSADIKSVNLLCRLWVIITSRTLNRFTQNKDRIPFETFQEYE